MAGKFTVDYWGSHPEAGNDDCWTGFDFETEEEAKAFFWAEITSPYYKTCTAYVEIDGPGVHATRKNPQYRPEDMAAEEAYARHEYAVMCGMAFGCEGYNDAMGW